MHTRQASNTTHPVTIPRKIIRRKRGVTLRTSRQPDRRVIFEYGENYPFSLCSRVVCSACYQWSQP